MCAEKGCKLKMLRFDCTADYFHWSRAKNLDIDLHSIHN